MKAITHKRKLTIWIQSLCCLFLFSSLASCRTSELRADSQEEVLQVTNFRLLKNPHELVYWHYQYLNRTFSLPSYRTPEGEPLPGWRYRVVKTRRFFTDQSARVYFRSKDLCQSQLFSSPRPAAGEAMRIWPVGSILVLETFSGQTALLENARPTVIDCIRKFKPTLASFPVKTISAGEWCYQRFEIEGKVRAMPEGADACHQCHTTALHLTGDLVFTVFSEG